HFGSLYARKPKTGQLLRRVRADERSNDATTPDIPPFSSVRVVGVSTIEARGVGSEKYKGKGRVFLSAEQAINILKSPVNVEEEWLSNPQNVIYWDAKNTHHQNSQFSEDSWELSEHLWAVTKMDDDGNESKIITQEDVKELLDAVGDDGDHVCF
ncbi:hypothetical protein Tsubulata_010653, partial [Turnera subulata]